MKLDAALLSDPTAPWCVGLATHYGWDVQSRHATYEQACTASTALRRKLRLEVGAVSVSHAEDGAELWPIETGINKLAELHRIELGKVRPDPRRVQRIEQQLTRLFAHGHELALRYGKRLVQSKRNNLVRLEFGEPTDLEIGPWRSVS
ncbi:MAG: hypothetical protein KME14_20515 [Tildeniella torsiva UHER 1998/13D]|jgi:hypothetical protein|nr:hypothetical protein [Tildeniella torsiva UHER 1998/13D]